MTQDWKAIKVMQTTFEKLKYRNFEDLIKKVGRHKTKSKEEIKSARLVE